VKKIILAVLLTVTAVIFAQDVTRLNDSTFVYPCVTTTGTDYNFIGLPLETGWTKGSDFDPTGTNIESVSRFDTGTQKTETGVYSTVFGWCKDIPVQTGGSYFISAKNNFDFSVTGDSVNVVYNLITTAGSDLNCIVHPLTKANLTTSALLGADLGPTSTVCNKISKWNPSTQVFVNSIYVLGKWQTPFNTSSGQPLVLNMTNAKVWPSGKVYDADINTTEPVITEKNAKGSFPWARMVFYHVVKETGSGTEEMVFPDELSNYESEYKLQFKAWIIERPTDILTQDSYDCGYMNIDGLSVAYINIANFPTSWQPGETLIFQFPYFGDD